MHRLFKTLFIAGLFLVLFTACAPNTQTPVFIEIGNEPVEVALSTPTALPTFVRPSPSPTMTPDLAQTQVNTPVSDIPCDVVLEALYETAGEFCIGKPMGYFCNGGLPPRAEPLGPISNALASPGSVVEAKLIDMIQTAPMLSNNSGGLLWMRLGEQVQISALLVGDVQIRDVTPDDGTFPAWQSFLVQTADSERACDIAPNSSFVAQSPVGNPTRLVVNGASVDLDGTLIVQTSQSETIFMLAEGLGRVTVFGQAKTLFPGQQINVLYNTGDFTRPINVPDDAVPLEFWRIHNLPVPLFEVPVLLPQPGFVTTEDTVNMRAEPSLEGRLLYQVPEGQVISVLGRDTKNEWYHVRLGNGETGWMKADLLLRRTGIIETAYDATPVPPQRLGELGNRGRVIMEAGSNLRQAPDTQFPIASTLPFGTELEVLARSPYSPWVKVNAVGQIGWLALTTIDTQVAISFLPIDYTVPYPAAPTAVPDWAGGHAYPDPRSGY